MNIVQIYSTPMWESQLPEFSTHKESFIKCVESFRQQNPEGISKTNINGYQSPMNLTKEPEMGPLFEYVAQMGMKAMFDLQFVNCDVYLSAAWVNFNEGRNQYNAEHVHQDTFSGVFYLQVPEKSGKLSLTNPGMNTLWQGAMLVDKKNKFNADRLKIEPVEGQIFLWPSYLSHAVEPNDHDETRISISFNVICIPKEQVEHTK
jgi:uncharacterized protein (TIGR02466 family)